jgi:Fic family protein
VAKAARALGKLDQVCAQLPDPKLLIRPTLFKEALDTSALEGTIGMLKDLLEAQLPNAQFLSPETKEINAYVRVAMGAFEMIRQRQLSIGLLCELQNELFKDVEDKPDDVGRLRQGLVWVGPRHRPIQEARFVPPPADDRLRSGLDSWQEWVQSPPEILPVVVQAAMAHYQFEALHPFGDGNGRIGRLIVVLQLLSSETLKHPAISLSPWFLRHRTEYQEHLLAVSCSGDWNPWINFFCDAIADQCSSVIAGAERLLTWVHESRQVLDQRRWTGKIQEFLPQLIEWPVTTIADTASRYGLTVMGATRMIQHLTDVGILHELTGKPYGRVFGAVDVMNIVEGI